jgi:hypothetical protein
MPFSAPYDTARAAGALAASSRRSRPEPASSLALENFAREREATEGNSGPTVRMTHEASGLSGLTSIIGGTQRTLILAVPTLDSGAPLPTEIGQRWMFRTIHQTSALRFEGEVQAVVTGQTPHLAVGLIGEIERRVVRKAPRVPVTLRASILTPEVVHSLVLDLSVGGARLAIERGARIEPGESVLFSTSLMIADRLYALELKSTVLGEEPAPAHHPQVAIHRLRFESVSEHSFLVLQAYLATEQADELDYFWRLVAGPLR